MLQCFGGRSKKLPAQNQAPKTPLKLFASVPSLLHVRPLITLQVSFSTAESLLITLRFIREEALDEAQVVRPAIKLTPNGISQGTIFSAGLGSCSITASLRSHFRRAGFNMRVFTLAAPENNKKRRWFAKARNKAITDIESKTKSKLSATASRMFAMSTFRNPPYPLLIFAEER